MVQCEICGKKIEKHIKLLVEGTKIYVCDKCVAYGKVEKEKQVKKTKKIEEEEEIFNYDLLKQERIKKGLSLNELASMLNEKASILKKVESGETAPSLKLLSKIRNFFKKNFLIEYIEIKPETKETKKLTIGDVIKIRKRGI